MDHIRPPSLGHCLCIGLESLAELHCEGEDGCVRVIMI